MFATHRITAKASKINFVVIALDEEAVRNIGDFLITAAPYADIRTRLIGHYGVPKVLVFCEIVKPGGLGDGRPSQLLRDMRNSMPPGIGENALKAFWLLTLQPSSLRRWTNWPRALIAFWRYPTLRASTCYPRSSLITCLAPFLRSLCRYSHSPRSSARLGGSYGNSHGPLHVRTRSSQRNYCVTTNTRFGSEARSFKPKSRDESASAFMEN
ncbi:uncharacterized protein LOC100574072 [Acyrthosiphon pisum]|uniref:Uncharacterized protein n=1 Tax=Acyrthosiphon pisum TaxID=7029 RepID=A0A8R1W6L1_ACYPI|nr:uncharacterized protein LOC100574072 [Acyrthosiphon pisum]|eukprot:XP_003246464.1 PREDICTED: uncharacterized protein LOC100574072 [Acyrthosiphon pisum]